MTGLTAVEAIAGFSWGFTITGDDIVFNRPATVNRQVWDSQLDLLWPCAAHQWPGRETGGGACARHTAAAVVIAALAGSPRR
jgi:hypothetical protein